MPTTSKAKAPKQKTPNSPKPSVEPPQKTGDEIWEELFATPESEAFFILMSAEIEEEKKKGTIKKGGWE